MTIVGLKVIETFTGAEAQYLLYSPVTELTIDSPRDYFYYGSVKFEQHFELSFLCLAGNQSGRTVSSWVEEWIKRGNELLGYILLTTNRKNELLDLQQNSFLASDDHPEEFDRTIYANPFIVWHKGIIRRIQDNSSLPTRPYAVSVVETRFVTTEHLTLSEVRHLLRVPNDVIVHATDVNDKTSIRQLLLTFLATLEQTEIVKQVHKVIADL